MFAQNFMDKVEETYLSENNDEKFIEFENILRSFNPSIEKAPDLYYVNIYKKKFLHRFLH